MPEQLLTGWGLTSPSLASVGTVASVEAVQEAVRGARGPGGRGLVARGLARSYGDAAQNAGGSVLDMTGLARIHSLVDGVVDVDAGVSLDTLMRFLLPAGWFVPVTPGTRYITVGGAVAGDIHGKNHHVEGTFCRHVISLDLVDGTGELVTLTPADPRFWATAGGMGLTGIVTRVRLRLVPVQTSKVLVDTERVADLDTLMDRMASGDDAYRYSVAWIDSLARGATTGRSVLTRGDHATLDDLPAPERLDPLAYAPTPRLRAPHHLPGGLLNQLTVGAFNELWFRRAPRRHRGLEAIPSFFHPLDGVLGWNRIYGPRGFVQWQMAVPDTAAETVRVAVQRLSQARCPSFLAVLKRFGPGNDGPLSFPIPGWTLALDIPAALQELPALLDGLDELVAESGGRVYLCKDSRLRPDLLEAMYPRLPQWREVAQQMDPHGLFSSDLQRRLGLRFPR
jgi:decaprenylphospho-beta-D-ribofuranose 2-oxidase